MRIWEVGGQETFRRLFHYYLHETSCIIWMIDPYDEERIEESLTCLYQNLCNPSLKLSNIPLAIIANAKNQPPVDDFFIKYKHLLTNKTLQDRIT